MKKYYYLMFLLLSSILLITGCSKEAPMSHEAATLTLVNALLDGRPMQLSSNQQVVNNNAFVHVGLLPGARDLTVFPIGDVSHPYYTSSKPLDVHDGEIYTLLLSGVTAAPDALLLSETLPLHADSTMGVRFINLSPASPAVYVTLSTTLAIKEFSDIGYQQVSSFKSYPVTSDRKTYTFQIRKVINGEQISSITLSGANFALGLPRFKNITLVLGGIVGGSPAAGITRINHY